MSKLTDKKIKHEIYLRGQSTRIARIAIKRLSKLERALIEVIEAATPGSNVRKINALLKEVKVLVQAGYKDLEAVVGEELLALSEYQAAWQVGQIETAALSLAAVNKFVPKSVSAEMLWSEIASNPFDGKLLKEWFTDQGEAHRKSIRNAVRAEIAEGAGVRVIAERVQAVSRKTNQRQAEAMVRTAVNHVANTADDLSYKRKKVERYQIVAILDHRTTPVCRDLDNNVYKVGEKGARLPPFHVGCRTFTIPIFDDDDLITEGYEDWLTR